MSQVPTGQSATLRGVVFDSLLTLAPLRDAEVFIEATDFSVITDSLGRFAFVDLPPGTYSVGIGHPSLDSLGLSNARRQVEVRAGLTMVLLGPPSGRTVMRNLCRATADSSRDGVVSGVVREAGSGAIAAGVEVRAEWQVTTFTVGKAATMQVTPRRASSRSDAMGRYTLCGVPTAVETVLWAMDDTRKAGPAFVFLRRRFIAIVDLDVAAPSRSATQSTLVTGEVRANDGRALPEATVRVIGDSVAVQTNDKGRFTLQVSRAGTMTLEARAIGFETSRKVATLRAGTQQSQSFVLAPAARQLDEMTVIADDVGFYRRLRRGTVGVFITAEDIRRMKPASTEEAIRSATGASFPAGFSVPQMELLRGGRCEPTIFIDGREVDEVPMAGDDRGRFARAKQGYRYPLRVSPSDILGIEIYDLLYGVPPELTGQVFMEPYKFIKQIRCGVFIWTQRASADRARSRATAPER
jgi:hypothetical protein